jgi:hypothetical protein
MNKISTTSYRMTLACQNYTHPLWLESSDLGIGAAG